MIYSLADKLKFEERPKLEVKKGVVLTVNNDAVDEDGVNCWEWMAAQAAD